MQILINLKLLYCIVCTYPWILWVCVVRFVRDMERLRLDYYVADVRFYLMVILLMITDIYQNKNTYLCLIGLVSKFRLFQGLFVGP